MTWATAPYATGMTSIGMVATTATDPTAPISYFFDFTDSPTGGTGGLDSGWQGSTSYINSGLGINHQYGYRVKAKDGANNETAYSTPTRYVYTLIEAPTGITFGAVTATSIQVQSTNTPSGLTRGSSGLLIENTTNGTNSGWRQDNSFWTSNPLSPNTLYSFKAKARNGDGVETGYSPTASKYTLANAPGTASFSNITQTSIRANWTVNGNPAGTQYYCENITQGTNSDWTSNTYWESTGLTCETSYTFRVKARNGDGVETAWTTLGSQSTQTCQAGTLQFSSATYSVDESGGSVTITVTRTGGSSGAVGVSYATASGTAIGGSDYTSTSGTLTWADGDTANKTFTVSIANDSLDEPNETFTVTLSSPTGGATLGSPSSATVTITDDDPTGVPMPGDLNGDGQTSISEVQKGINYFLNGSPAEPCFDLNGDGRVTIDEVQKMINAFLGVTL